MNHELDDKLNQIEEQEPESGNPYSIFNHDLFFTEQKS